MSIAQSDGLTSTRGSAVKEKEEEEKGRVNRNKMRESTVVV